MKKLFNTRDRMPDDMIDGFVASYPALVAPGTHPRVVLRGTPNPAKVVLLISRHEGELINRRAAAMMVEGEGRQVRLSSSMTTSAPPPRDRRRTAVAPPAPSSSMKSSAPPPKPARPSTPRHPW